MEIQHGKGPWANPVSGIVPLGTTLTMVIGINDKQGETKFKDKDKDKDKDYGNWYQGQSVLERQS